MPSDSAFAVKPTLVGERVTLRPYREEDLPHLTAAVNDPEAGTTHRQRAHHGRVRGRHLPRAGAPAAVLHLMVIDHDSGRYPPQALINALDEVSPDRVVILGGPVAVSQRVEDQLNEEYPRWAE